MMTDAKPLIVITRPLPQGERFAADIVATYGNSVDVMLMPVLQITPLGTDVDRNSDVIFTSENAVQCLGQNGTGRRAFCVGPRTGRAARDFGFNVIVAESHAESLITTIQQQIVDRSLIHVRGTHSRGDIAARLSSSGISVSDAVVYDQTEIQLTEAQIYRVQSAGRVVFPIFSPRTAVILSKQLASIERNISVVALSDEIARHVTFAKEIDVAPSISASSVIKCIGRHIVA